MSNQDRLRAALSKIIEDRVAKHLGRHVSVLTVTEATVRLSADEWDQYTNLPYTVHGIGAALEYLCGCGEVGQYYITPTTVFFEVSELSNQTTRRLAHTAVDVAEGIRSLSGLLGASTTIVDVMQFPCMERLIGADELCSILPIVRRLIGAEGIELRTGKSVPHELVIYWPTSVPATKTETPQQRPGQEVGRVLRHRAANERKPKAYETDAAHDAAVKNLTKHRARTMDWVAFVRDKENDR